MIEYFNIPAEGQIRQRVYLKDLIEEASLNGTELNYLKKEIASIHLVGVLDETTIRVSSFVNDEYAYQAIYIFNIELRSHKHLMSINERLQQTFQNPVVIVYEYKENFMISSAPKRINKAKPDRTTIEGIYTSHLFKVDQQHQTYLARLNLELIRELNLYLFYLHLNDVIYSERIINLMGFYPEKIVDAHLLKDALREVDSLKAEKNKLEQTLKETSMMRDRMNIYVSVKNIERQIQLIVQYLREKI